MKVLTQGYKGLSLILTLNADRIYSVAALGCSLALAAWLATL